MIFPSKSYFEVFKVQVVGGDNWAKKHEKDNHKKIAKDNLMKFENIFLGLGAEVLEFTSSALTVNPDKAIRDIKKRLDKTIKDVKKSGDPKKIEKLRQFISRMIQ